MAVVTLLTPCPPDVTAFGTRSLSAALRAVGHETRLVFFPGNLGLALCAEDHAYGDALLHAVTEVTAGSDLVCVSFMSSYLSRATALTHAVRQAPGSPPVVWGGTHVLRRPAESLQVADFLLMGEGEEAIPELLAAMSAGDPTTVAGVWTDRDGAVVDNGLRPLVRDLDALPFYDFSNEHHYVHLPEYGSLAVLDDALFREFLPQLPYFRSSLKRTYRTMTDRGCPHGCAYCNVPTIKRVFADDPAPYYRMRSPGHVLEELAWMTTRHPAIEAIQIFDDTFFSRPMRWFEGFCDAYKERIGLPLYAQASPTTLSGEKLDRMLDAGLVYVEMGVQTGSPTVRRLYGRKETNERILDAAAVVQQRRREGRASGRPLLRPDYHIIIDNPWESEDDLLMTVRLLARFPQPYGLCLASLIIFPDTPLFHKAVADGLLPPEAAETGDHPPFHVRHGKNWAGFLLYLLTFERFPKPLMRLLLHPRVTEPMRRRNPEVLYKLVYLAGEKYRLVGKGVRFLAHGRFGRIAAYARRRRLAARQHKDA